MDTNAEIVRDDVLAIIPTDKLSKYAEARAELAGVMQRLDDLLMKARNLTKVETKEQFKEAAEVLAEARKNKKAGEFAIGPFLAIVMEVETKLREIRDAGQVKIKSVEELLVQPLADYDRREKEAAKREEDEKNAARRKQQEAVALQQQKDREKLVTSAVRSGEITKTEAKQQKQAIAEETKKVAADVKTVKVKPDLPAVSGLRRTVEWKWKMVNITLVPREALYPNTKEDGTYDPAKFPQITALVNQTKDKAKAEAACPGIEVWSTDKV